MEYPACVDACPAGAIELVDEASLDPAAGWNPFRALDLVDPPGRTEDDNH
jgi:Fe-S-cluster-containing hydrogenase component 2